MFSYFESNFIKKNSFGKMVSNFGYVTIFAKGKFVFDRHFEKEHVLMFFLLIYGCLWCIHIWCKFCTEIPTGKYVKVFGFQWTPLVHKRE